MSSPSLAWGPVAVRGVRPGSRGAARQNWSVPVPVAMVGEYRLGAASSAKAADFASVSVTAARVWAAGVTGQSSSRMMLIVPSRGAVPAAGVSATSSSTRRQRPSLPSVQRAGSPARAALPATPAVANASTRMSSKAADPWAAHAMLAAVPMSAVRSGGTPISAQAAAWYAAGPSSAMCS